MRNVKIVEVNGYKLIIKDWLFVINVADKNNF